MLVVVLSVALAAVGVGVSRAAAVALARGDGERDVHAYWAIGLVSLVPAWVVAFVGLLGAAPVRRPEVVPAVAWTLSAALSLIAAIVTEAMVRRGAEDGQARPPLRVWAVGAVTLVPALAAALIGLLLR